HGGGVDGPAGPFSEAEPSDVEARRSEPSDAETPRSQTPRAEGTAAAGTASEESVGEGPEADRPAPITLAFDHARILADGLDRARAKIEYSPLATAFLRHDFTIPELRAVYEAVWDEKLHAGNFHRKVLSVPGFVESTGTTTERGGARGGPRARNYCAGDAQLLHPALLRPTREDEIR
ncbi:DNA hydrolase, partial [Kitasatospora sp. NPDC056181]